MTTRSLPERQAPAFSFYAKDFLAGTLTFSLAERGAYITLLAYQWDNGSVPDDARERCRVLGCTRREADTTWERIREKFQPCGDAWRNARLEQERTKQANRRDALAINGTKGADARWHGKAKAKAMAPPLANASQTDGLSFPSPSSSSSSTPVTQRAELPGVPTHAKRAGDFCEWYADTHSRLIGLGYIGNPRKDYEKALELVALFGDAELRDAATIWFGQQDSFALNGTRTITKFGSRATVLVGQARELAS